LFAGLVAAMSLPPAIPRACAADEPGDPLSLALTRAEAVQSGRFTYKFEFTGSSGPNEYSLILKGKSWKKWFVARADDMPWSVQPEVLKHHSPDDIKKPTGLVVSIEICHNGRTVEYQRTPQPDGRIQYYSRVALGKRNPDSLSPSFPRHLGSFWYPSTKEFVAKNRKDVLHTIRAKDNNGVDVYELPVAKEDVYKAFYGVNQMTQNGGILRLHIPAKLKGAISKIEHVGHAGVGTVLEAGDFVEVNGVVVARECTMRHFTPLGVGFQYKLTFSEVKDINREIPDREFIITLPIGTSVADARSGQYSTFFEVTGPRSIPQDLEEVYAVAGPPRSWLKLWWVGATGEIARSLGPQVLRRFRGLVFVGRAP